MWEWNEATHLGVFRMVRGGAIHTLDFSMYADYRLHKDPMDEFGHMGFRVAEVPEPATLTMLALGAAALLRRKRS